MLLDLRFCVWLFGRDIWEESDCFYFEDEMKGWTPKHATRSGFLGGDLRGHEKQVFLFGLFRVGKRMTR